MPKWLKRLIVVVLVTALIAGAAIGGLTIYKNRSKEPVKVYDVKEFITDYWGDSTETSGLVRTDKLQKVYPSDTQTVKEIFVKEGQEVKVGDPLISYDTTLTDLDLQKAELALKKLEMSLDRSQKELEIIKGLRPYVEVLVQPPAAPIVYESEETPLLVSGTGTYEDPFYLLFGEEDDIDNALLKMLVEARAEEVRKEQKQETPESGTKEETEDESAEESSEESTEESPGDESAETESGEGESSEDISSEDESSEEESPEESSEDESAETESEETESAEDEEEEDPELYAAYVAFVNRMDDALNAPIIYTFGLRIEDTGEGYSFRYYEPFLSEDILDFDEEPEAYYISYGSEYTAAEIADMRNEKEAEIAGLTDQIKLSNVELTRLKREVSDGMVTAKIDGVVKAVRDPEDASKEDSAVVEVSAGGGYYIDVAIGELDLDSMKIGQSVSVTSWETEAFAEGTVSSISDQPAENAYSWSEGNPNVSYYAFTVFVDEDADLRENSYVNVVYDANQGGAGKVYLMDAFILNEEGKSCIYVQGADGKLEKRYLATGRSLWGSYTEVKSGLKSTDKIAFPYGKDIVEGAETEVKPASELYEGMYY